MNTSPSVFHDDTRAGYPLAPAVAAAEAAFDFNLFAGGAELDPVQVAGLPVLGADPVDDYWPILEQSGFMVDRYDEVLGCPEPMISAYSAVLASKDALAAEMGEGAVAALSAEIALTLARSPCKRRVLAVATRN